MIKRNLINIYVGMIGFLLMKIRQGNVIYVSENMYVKCNQNERDINFDKNP